MIKISVLLVLIAALAWCFGVRIHPEALFPSKDSSFVRVTLNSGEIVTGNLIRRSDEQTEINMGGAQISFSKNEILSVEAAVNPEKISFITYSAEDSIIPIGQSQPQNGTPKKSGAVKNQKSGSLFGGLDVTSNIQSGLNTRNQVAHMKNALNRKTEETQSIK